MDKYKKINILDHKISKYTKLRDKMNRSLNTNIIIFQFSFAVLFFYMLLAILFRFYFLFAQTSLFEVSIVEVFAVKIFFFIFALSCYGFIAHKLYFIIERYLKNKTNKAKKIKTAMLNITRLSKEKESELSLFTELDFNDIENKLKNKATIDKAILLFNQKENPYLNDQNIFFDKVLKEFRSGISLSYDQAITLENFKKYYNKQIIEENNKARKGKLSIISKQNKEFVMENE
ncbi:MAG: hypothetical protein CL760_05650 [Chloroflexi bacterium]|nr:hypothetical protein [Chloroflexota bacterium]|tara:strand:- start:5102 stop:5797 length:696 start_codon:yes stop_codon:yes gene_type:complete